MAEKSCPVALKRISEGRHHTYGNEVNTMTEKLTLTENQYAVIEGLLTCATRKEAARQAGVSRETLYKYLRNPNFVAELRKYQEAILSGVVSSMIGLAEESVKALRDILSNKRVSAAVRVRAALGWLSQMHKFSELRVLSEAKPAELNPEWTKLRYAIGVALKPYPEALKAVGQALKEAGH